MTGVGLLSDAGDSTGWDDHPDVPVQASPAPVSVATVKNEYIIYVCFLDSIN